MAAVESQSYCNIKCKILLDTLAFHATMFYIPDSDAVGFFVEVLGSSGAVTQAQCFGYKRFSSNSITEAGVGHRQWRSWDCLVAYVRLDTLNATFESKMIVACAVLYTF